MIKGKEKKIALELIDEPKSSVRFEINQREIYELSESIKDVGLLQAPLVVEREGRYEIVAGHRRLLACRLAEFNEMRCYVVKLNEQEIAIVKATENLQDKHLTSVEEGKIYADLYDKHGMTINQIAKKMGKSATHIKRVMDLLRFDDLVIEALHAGKISMAVAEQLERIDEKKEKLRYLEIAVENGANATVVKMWVEDIRKSLQYINNRGELPPPDIDFIVPAKTYATCEVCDEPVDYREIKIIKMCPGCHRQLIDELMKARGK